MDFGERGTSLFAFLLLVQPVNSRESLDPKDGRSPFPGGCFSSVFCWQQIYSCGSCGASRRVRNVLFASRRHACVHTLTRKHTHAPPHLSPHSERFFHSDEEAGDLRASQVAPGFCCLFDPVALDVKCMSGPDPRTAPLPPLGYSEHQATASTSPILPFPLVLQLATIYGLGSNFTSWSLIKAVVNNLFWSGGGDGYLVGEMSLPHRPIWRAQGSGLRPVGAFAWILCYWSTGSPQHHQDREPSVPNAGCHAASGVQFVTWN